MKSHQETQSKSGIEDVMDITDQYPKIKGVIQHLSIETNRKFDFKGYMAELKALGIPGENIGISFCG